MDSTWQAAQNWVLFAGVAGGLGYYYWSQNQPAQATATSDRRRSVQEPQSKGKRRATLEQAKPDVKVAPKTSNDSTKKGKGQTKKQPQVQPTAPAVAQKEQADEEEIDMSTRQFAEQMSKARKGNNLSAPKGSNQKIRTVKAGNANTTQELSSASSQAGVDADDDLSPVESPAMRGGDVSDMLEPASKGPSTLRLTVSAKSQKEKVAKQSKEQDVETKKQRQNRMKKEQQRLEREAEEKVRKVQEEKQRRTAREARGEPAKNGMTASKPPASIWTAPKSTQSTSKNTAPATNGTSSAQLLDTFDAESSASSTGGKAPSTAATSTTEGESAKRDRDNLSEEDQMAMAVKQSEDESGWTTVAVPKKQQKKKSGIDEEGTGSSTPIEAKPVPKAAPVASKPTTNGKPNGFQALNDMYQQRADVDTNDPENWDA